MRDSDGLCPEQTAVGKVGKCDDFQTGSAAQSCVIALPAPYCLQDARLLGQVGLVLPCVPTQLR